MKHNLTVLFLLLYQICCSQIKAEDAIKNFETKYPQEKIHIEFNKKDYLAGENIWFKIYVFNECTKSKISNSVKVELLANDKTTIAKKTFKLTNSETEGNIELDNKLPENVYYIRVYTSWMTNFSEDFQYLKEIKIYNPQSIDKLGYNKNFEQKAIVVPEGGNLIAEIPNKVAVRLLNNNNELWTATLIEKNNPSRIIKKLNSLDSNVSIFSFTPQSNNNYEVIVEKTDGTKIYAPLPLVQSSGVQITMTSNPSEVQYQINTNSNSLKNKKYKIIGTIGNRLVYVAKINSIEKNTSYKIPTSELIDGILQLTVFDELEHPISSRLCFIQKNTLDFETPKLSDQSFNREPRKLNTFRFDQLPKTNYYISVTDLEQKNNDNILSRFWLTGDITTPINNPSQYFTKNKNFEALDAIMISETWKRFNWQQLVKGISPTVKNNNDLNLSYNGFATDLQGNPIQNKYLNIIYNDAESNLNYESAKTDSFGKFVFTPKNFENALNVKIVENTASDNNSKNSKEVNLKVFLTPANGYVNYLKKLPVSQYTIGPSSNLNTPPDVINDINNLKNQNAIANKYIEIDALVLKISKKEKADKLNKELSSPRFRYFNEEVFDLINDNSDAQNYDNILRWISVKTGVIFKMELGSLIPDSFLYINEISAGYRDVEALHIEDIAMVKVAYSTAGRNIISILI